MAKPKLSAEDKKWMAQQDASTLVSADEIVKDPKRMAAVKKHVKDEAKAVIKDQKKLEKVVKKAAKKKTTKKKGKKR